MGKCSTFFWAYPRLDSRKADDYVKVLGLHEYSLIFILFHFLCILYTVQVTILVIVIYMYFTNYMCL